MEYRINRRTGDRISVLGLGASSIAHAGETEGIETLRFAFENGINYFDLAAGAAESFAYYGKAFEHDREKVFYQIHFGANYTTGAYGWTTDLEEVKRSIDWQLARLKTDHIDYGFIHCLDQQPDWQTYCENGVFDYLRALQKQGVVRHLGLSSHVPQLVHTVLDSGVLDMVMFSINPAYDFHHGDYANGSAEERTRLYRRCEAEGTGISVMKPFAGGQLLDDRTSPFGKALTEFQCLQYALDKPGVLTVLPGVRGQEDLRRLLPFCAAPAAEKDYSVIGSFAPGDAAGKCVYCNHCAPCPAGLDVGLINKYYDLARAGDEMAAGHYRKLEKHADACLHCGHCNSRCPFGVDQSARMEEIARYFGA